MSDRIYLSSPHMSDEGYEMEYVKEAFDTNWIAPLGGNVNKFEEELAVKVGSKSAVFFFLFMIVAFITSANSGFVMDETVAYWANQNNAVWLQKVMEVASVIGSSELILLVTVIIGLVLLIKRSWRHFFFFFVLSVGGVVLNLGLKMLVQRARPGDEVSYIEVFNYSFELQSYSFPSGHTARATILFLFLMYLAIQSMKGASFKVISTIVYLVLLVSVSLSRIC